MSETKTCFVICPIGADASPTRVRADKLLKFIIQDVVETLGYRISRADTLSKPGLITNQIIQNIVDCDLLIADLSESNPNVFYELAIRHGLKKPFVHIIDSAEKIPFDNSQVRAIQIDLSDLYSVDRAKTELRKQIENIRESDQIESPISVAFDLDILRKSDRADENILASLVDQVSRLSNKVEALSRIGSSRPRRFTPPTSKDQLLSLLNQLDDDELFFEVHKSNISSFKIGHIIFDDEISNDVMARLSSVLKRATGIEWNRGLSP